MMVLTGFSKVLFIRNVRRRLEDEILFSVLLSKVICVQFVLLRMSQYVLYGWYVNKDLPYECRLRGASVPKSDDIFVLTYCRFSSNLKRCKIRIETAK